VSLSRSAFNNNIVSLNLYRYLVIIDDIWQSGEWETIKKSLPDNNLGSRIVTASRVNAITDKWRDDFDALVYRIGYFDYWNWKGQPFRNKMIDMYADMVGEGFDRDHPIVDMCRGMPLAFACSMFSALAKERERQEQQRLWLCTETRDLQDRIEEQVRRNGIQNTPGFEPLVESLELGYNHLPHHMLKTCLLYCGTHPKGQLLFKDDLVKRWIEQGFVCKEEVAKDYFDELISSGFIIGYSLHPMMRNYLRCKLREHNFITCTSDIPSSPVGRLCIDHWPASSDAVDPLSGFDDWHHIRSLVVLKDAERVPYKRLQHLRVLNARNHSGALENQHLKDMCGLLRLRHLLVSCGEGITEIPTEVARLQYLETLEGSRTKIIRLPAEIGDLKQLKTLDVSWNKELAELPREMGNLKHILETLCIRGSNIREQAWEIIRTLKKLKTLDVSCNRGHWGTAAVEESGRDLDTDQRGAQGDWETAASGDAEPTWNMDHTTAP
jgi:disease resistance protein RPM1